MGSFTSLLDLMDSNGSVWVHISPYASLWIVVGPYGSLCFFMGGYGSL